MSRARERICTGARGARPGTARPGPSAARRARGGGGAAREARGGRGLGGRGSGRGGRRGRGREGEGSSPRGSKSGDNHHLGHNGEEREVEERERRLLRGKIE
jgi:hypothetical protein